MKDKNRKAHTFNGTSTDVTDELSKSDSSTFHFFESILFRDGHRGLFDNLLVPTLHRAVTSEEGNGISILVSEQLNFKMPCLTGKLHDKDRRT